MSHSTGSSWRSTLLTSYSVPTQSILPILLRQNYHPLLRRLADLHFITEQEEEKEEDEKKKKIESEVEHDVEAQTKA